jgi:hypothetical protein
MKKLTLRVESLAVESFRVETGPRDGGRGTVHGQAPCTHWQSCVCPTAYYHCGTGPATIFSCDYTRAAPCFGSYDDCA